MWRRPGHRSLLRPLQRSRPWFLVPDGIKVRWGTSELGTIPLVDVPVPCGESDVVMTHPRYELCVEQIVEAKLDAVATVDVTMQRPLGRVSLRSIPPGAAFTVEGASVGHGTTEIEVRVFTHLDITATLRRVYVRGPRDSILVELQAAAAGRRMRACRGPSPTTRSRAESAQGWYDSARFRILRKIAATPAGSGVHYRFMEPGRADRALVILVDDEPTILSSYGAFLKAAGYAVVTTTSGAEAAAWPAPCARRRCFRTFGCPGSTESRSLACCRRSIRTSP